MTDYETDFSVAQLSFHSPVGDLTLTDVNGEIVSVDWGWGAENQETPLLLAAKDWLNHYFDGEHLPLDFPLHPAGTPFQQRVWAAIQAIPVGETRSYQDVALTLGSHPRAIGMACGRNPIPLLIPCHRVIAKDGRLNGYSGDGGLETKSFLLTLESSL